VTFRPVLTQVGLEGIEGAGQLLASTYDHLLPAGCRHRRVSPG
jgi:hypothetical protein